MRTRNFLLFALFAVCSHDGAAQDPRFRIQGLRTEHPAPNTVRATGGAATRIGDWSIQAELIEVRLDPKTRNVEDVFAEGFVVIERGNDRLHLLRLRLDPRTGRGTFELHRAVVP